MEPNEGVDRVSFLQDFKTFALRGNVMDLAVGVMIGAAFGKIVSALVETIFMPILGALTAGVQFNDLALTLLSASEGRPAVVLRYGQFVQATIDFVIIAFIIFLVLRFLQKWSVAGVAGPKVSDEAKLLKEIRDLLQKQQNDARQ